MELKGLLKFIEMENERISKINKRYENFDL
jgi:hypothetical protein